MNDRSRSLAIDECVHRAGQRVSKFPASCIPDTDHRVRLRPLKRHAKRRFR